MAQNDSSFFKTIGMNPGVLALSVARMTEAIGNSILFILIPLYVAKLPSEHLHFAVPVLVGILISFYGFVASIIQPLMGALSDRLGNRKNLIQVGLLLMGLGTLGYTIADQYLDLIVLRAIQGIGVAITIPASMALMTAITRKESRGGSMGVYSVLRMIGFASGPIIGGFLETHVGFDAAFYAGAGFIFLGLIMVQIWVKEVPGDKSSAKQHFHIFDRKLFSSGIVAAALSTFIMATSFSMLTTLENEFNQRLAINAFLFGIAFSSMMVSRIFLQIPIGRLADIIGRKPLILGGLIILGISTALTGYVTMLWQLVGIRLLQGVASAAVGAPALALASDLSEKGGEGRQMSVVTTGFGFGIAVGPLLAGILATVFFELPFLMAGGLSLIASFIVLRIMPESIEGDHVLFKTVTKT